MLVPPSAPSAAAGAVARTTASSSSACFVYGTLMSPDVVNVLLGRAPTTVPRATLRDHARHPVRGRVFPAVVPARAASVDGALLLGVTSTEMRCLDYFEDDAYTRSLVEVEVPGGRDESGGDGGASRSEKRTVEAHAYIWTRRTSELDLSRGWDYGAFLEEHLEWYLDKVVGPCRDEIERIVL